MTPQRRRLDLSRPAREVHHLVRMLRFMGMDEELVVRVGDRWLRLVRTSLEPTGGAYLECGDGPLWIAESAPADPRPGTGSATAPPSQPGRS